MNLIAGIAGGSTLVLIGLCAWLTYKLVAAQRETMSARDLLNDERKVAAEWEGKHKSTTAALKVARTRMEQEQTLRAISERRCEVAQQRVRELLRKHVVKATNEEIQELTDEVFSTPLAIAPRPVERVPNVPRSQDPRDGLLDPFAPDLQPPKSAG